MDDNRKRKQSMAIVEREDTNVLRLSAYWSNIRSVPYHKRFPLRILSNWINTLRHQHSSDRGSERQVIDMRSPIPMENLRLPVEVHLTTKSKVKKWAYENAWTLILMGILNGLTWAYLLYQGVKNSVG